VLSIGKLGHGQESYYLETVASGAEDYYIGRGEAPGRWLGTMTAELGLDGRVNAADLGQVLAGVDPISGDRFARGGERRVPGFDLTFCAPKSVSVLWGLGDREVSAVVRAAHDRSVDAALRYVEEQACWSRRGTNGFVALRGDGFVGAAFRHRTSRAGDPHLHSHVVVANATRSDDGRWGALDARHLYLHAKTAGYLYEAHLRAELTGRLGVEWTPVVNGIADIVGIPATVLDRFSTRRHEIEAELAERGVTSARAAQFAVLETRQAKDYNVDPLLLHGLWAEQVAEIGWDRDQLDTVLGKPSVALTGEGVQTIGGRLLGPDGLTKQASTFDRRAVIRAWCAELAAGADINVVEQFADETLADPHVVPLQPSQHGPVGTMRRRANGRSIDTPSAGPRYSTQDLLDLERRLVNRAVTDTDQPLGVADEDSVVGALSLRPTLSEEQLQMVATLTTSGRAVDVVIAAAGTGKTFSLDAARDAWQRSGHLVIGTALAARAAAELEANAGIPSHTIASLFADLEHGARGPFPPGTVLVVDEAGMVGTRQLARVLDHAAAAHTKVVLVGDPRQLPEIDAGGLLRGLGERMPTIRLTENRRQQEAWERDALAQLRDGHVDQAVAAYEQHGRIRTDQTAPAARNAMTADWWAATLAGDRVLMLASRWSDVDDLNSRARARLQEAGTLTGPVLTVDERPYQTGDRIMTLRNDRRLGVRNGTFAAITHIDVAQREMTVRTDTGTELVLPARYLEAGHVRHAYATTIHKAQGQTVDRAFVLGSDTLYQEAGYVALSRGRSENRIYLVSSEPRPEAHTQEATPPEPIAALTQALGISHAQALAVDTGIDRWAIRRELADLRRERRRLQTVTRDCPQSRGYDIESLTTKRQQNIDNIAHLQSDLAAIDKEPRWRQRDERRGRRVVLTTDIRYYTSAIEKLDQAIERAHQAQKEHDEYLKQHHDEMHELPRVEHAINRRFAQLVNADVADPPPYLCELGAPPKDPVRLARWRDAAEFVEHYRVDRYITDPDRPLGDAATYDTRRLQELAAQVHNPTREIDHGVELS
jgi:conjugative relaxase-like TrwC/TraI family protein